jgi:hypothetical protein
MVRDAPAQQPPWQTPYPAEKARGGEIIPRTRQQRMIFVGGLIATVVIALLLGVLAAFFA